MVRTVSVPYFDCIVIWAIRDMVRVRPYNRIRVTAGYGFKLYASLAASSFRRERKPLMPWRDRQSWLFQIASGEWKWRFAWELERPFGWGEGEDCWSRGGKLYQTDSKQPYLFPLLRIPHNQIRWASSMTVRILSKNLRRAWQILPHSFSLYSSGLCGTIRQPIPSHSKFPPRKATTLKI